MADQKTMLAQNVYQTVCTALDERNWKYQTDDAKLLVHFGVNGEDIPMQFIIMVDAERQLIRVLSPLSFKMSDEKRVEAALAVCAASYNMADGGFDYDISDGSILFRMAASFRESVIGTGMIHYMISCTCAMVDKYNDKFFALSKGLLSLQDFLTQA